MNRRTNGFDIVESHSRLKTLPAWSSTIVRGEVAEQIVQIVDVLLDGLLGVGGGVLLGRVVLGGGVPLAGGEVGRGLGHGPHLGDAGQVRHQAVRSPTHTVVLIFAF